MKSDENPEFGLPDWRRCGKKCRFEDKHRLAGHNSHCDNPWGKGRVRLMACDEGLNGYGVRHIYSHKRSASCLKIHGDKISGGQPRHSNLLQGLECGDCEFLPDNGVECQKYYRNVRRRNIETSKISTLSFLIPLAACMKDQEWREGATDAKG